MYKEVEEIKRKFPGNGIYSDYLRLKIAKAEIEFSILYHLFNSFLEVQFFIAISYASCCCQACYRIYNLQKDFALMS